MSKKKKILILALAVVGLMLIIGSFFGIRYWNDHKSPNFTRAYTLYVTPQMTVQQVFDSLEAGAGVKNMASLQRCFDKVQVQQSLQPGKYIIKPQYSSMYVARMLANKWTTPQNLTLSGTIRSKGVLARKIAAQMMVDSAAVAEALNSEHFLSTYGFTPEDVFAMILPDTYQVQWDDSVEEIFSRLKKEYDKFWNDERLKKASALRLTPGEVSVLASIVNGETNKDFEYPIIAGVYLNRYKKGMRLEADPTVAFCFDYKLDRVLKKHLQVDSPYNTYKYAGLPPAPINVPLKACIDAVLNPDPHDYIFFCASPEFDGTHRFTGSFKQHQRNAQEFQRALDRRKKSAKQ